MLSDSSLDTSLLGRASAACLVLLAITESFKDRAVIMRSQDADTLAEARQVFKDLYDRADRELPSYFPDTGGRTSVKNSATPGGEMSSHSHVHQYEEPAEKKYDIGKWMWEDASESDLVEFQRRNGNLIAKFDDSLSVYSSVRKYARTLPNEARAQQDGNQIQIKAEEAVADWFPLNIDENNGIISKIF